MAPDAMYGNARPNDSQLLDPNPPKSQANTGRGSFEEVISRKADMAPVIADIATPASIRVFVWAEPPILDSIYAATTEPKAPMNANIANKLKP